VVEDGKAVGVELDGGKRIEAGRVVVNLPSQELFEILDESLVDAEFASLCKNLVPTAGVVLDYGLKKKISEDSGLWYLWDPMSFGCFTSNLRPDTAPAGKQLLTWYLPTNLADVEDEERGKAKEREVEDAVGKAFPGLEDAIEWRRSMRLKMVDGVEVNVDQHRNKRLRGDRREEAVEMLGGRIRRT